MHYYFYNLHYYIAHQNINNEFIINQSSITITSKAVEECITTVGDGDAREGEGVGARAGAIVVGSVIGAVGAGRAGEGARVDAFFKIMGRRDRT